MIKQRALKMIHAFKVFISLFFLTLFLNSYSQEVDTVYLRRLKELDKNKIDLNCFPWKKSDDVHSLMKNTSQKLLDTTLLIGNWEQKYAMQIGEEPANLNEQGCKLVILESGEFNLIYSYLKDTINGSWSCSENTLKLLFNERRLLYPDESVKNWSEEIIELRKFDNLIFTIYLFGQGSFLTYSFSTCPDDEGLMVRFTDFIKSDR